MEAWQKTPTSQGIIAQMAELYSVDVGVYPPFLNGGTIAMYVDNYYYYVWSGDKFVSPMVRKMKEANGLTWKANVAKSVWAVIQSQLFKEWAAFSAQYDPVSNYHVHEVVEYDHTEEGHYTDRGTDTKTYNGDINSTVISSGTTTSFATTYDSTAEKETGKVTTSPAAMKQSYDELEETSVYGKGRDSNGGANDDLETTKTGNLGILPTAQLLQMDIELWKMNFYTTIMFPLIDKAIALPIY